MEGRQTRPGGAHYVVCGQIVHTYRLGFGIPAWLPYWDAWPSPGTAHGGHRPRGTKGYRSTENQSNLEVSQKPKPRLPFGRL